MSAKMLKVKKAIKDNYQPCGIFFSRNIAGDQMFTVYEDEGVTIDVCYYWEYLEVFGLNEEEEKEIEKFYEKISRTGGKNEHNSLI